MVWQSSESGKWFFGKAEAGGQVFQDESTWSFSVRRNGKSTQRWHYATSTEAIQAANIEYRRLGGGFNVLASMG